MRNTYVSVFNNFKSRSSDKKISIWNWLIEDLGFANKIEEIRNSTCKENIRQAKSNLPAVTMSGIFGERNSKKIIEHSGFICIDIDGKDNPHIDNFELLKQKLASSQFIQYAGLSVSGNGLFCLIKISNPVNHKEHFNSLLNYFLEMEIVIDKGCSDITRLRIYSTDDKPYINEDAEVYTDMEAVTSTVKTVGNNSNNNINRDFKVNIEQGRNISVQKLPREMMVTIILEQIELNQIDITQEYNDWFNLCIAIAFRYKEKGRDMFHKISQYHPSYSFETCDSLFTTTLNKGYTKAITVLFDIAEKYGIN